MSGLLPPAEVDAGSNYRRYAPDQLERAGRISLLRRLGMPLSLIGETVDRPDAEAVRLLDRWWATEEAAVGARRESYLWLRTHMAHGGEPARDHPVATMLRPACKVATIQVDVVDQHNLVTIMGTAEWEIRRHLEEQGAATTAEHWVIYPSPVTPDTAGSIEVCVPYSGAVEPVARLTLRVEPEQLVAYTTVERDDCFYPRITQAYEAVGEFVAAAGHPMAGPPREIYLDWWDRLRGTDPFVHVAMPIEG